MLPDIEPLIKTMSILLFIFVPLGIWKMIDIMIWFFQHISIAFK